MDINRNKELNLTAVRPRRRVIGLLPAGMDRPNADNVRQNVTAGNSEAFCVLLQDGPRTPPLSRNQTKAFPRCRCFPERRRPACVSLPRLDEAAGEGKLGEIGSEGVWRHLVYTGVTWTDCDAHFLSGVQWHVLESLFGTFVRMHTVEIEREGVEELKLLVVLEQVLFLEPCRRLRLSCDLGLEPDLTVDLAFEHPFSQRPVMQRDFVDEHKV